PLASRKPRAGTARSVLRSSAQGALRQIAAACPVPRPACAPLLPICPSVLPPSRFANHEWQFRYYRNAQNCSQGGALAVSYQWQRRIDRLKNAAQGFFGGGENNQPRPKLCPACGSLVGIHATRCHECGASLTFSLAAASKKLSSLMGDNEAPATTALLIANILMFGVTWMASMARGQQGFSVLFTFNNEALYRLGMGIPF